MQPSAQHLAYRRRMGWSICYFGLLAAAPGRGAAAASRRLEMLCSRALTLGSSSDLTSGSSFSENVFINSTPDFIDGPKVLNGASDLMVAAFGDKGRHARTTIGVASLPADAAVEVEGLFEVA